ncbi:hypothetical protein LY76DRAFT_610465 [Colletotrichum caudatum]|nr:hypothetical protein LY76DRAFT_610465 [Colletotrichum caudatum]
MAARVKQEAERAAALAKSSWKAWVLGVAVKDKQEQETQLAVHEETETADRLKAIGDDAVLAYRNVMAGIEHVELPKLSIFLSKRLEEEAATAVGTSTSAGVVDATLDEIVRLAGEYEDAVQRNTNLKWSVWRLEKPAQKPRQKTTEKTIVTMTMYGSDDEEANRQRESSQQ